MRKVSHYISLLFIIGSILSCDNYLGDKTDLGFIEVPQTTFREVAYVPVLPILDRFTYPTDIIAGFDELIYVVDNATEEVIALDESGKEIGRKKVQGARGIAQDRRLDLLVIGTKTDTSTGIPVDRSCIYRLQLNQAEGYGLEHAKIVKEVVHPFYFKTSAITRDEDVEFNRVGVISDNSYYVTRTGNFNSPNQIGGPDNSVLLFDKNDNFVTPIIVNSSQGGSFSDFFKRPFGLSTLAKAPQISVDSRGDFIYSSLSPNNVLKVQYIVNQSSIDGSVYVPRFDWDNDPEKGDSFINDPFKFKEPVGIEYDADDRGFIFVVDKGTDSLYQFTFTGIEGVQPPPASGETKFTNTSFGGQGIGPANFNDPMAVAYKDDIVYVADAGNGRILRFKLTLDIN